MLIEVFSLSGARLCWTYWTFQKFTLKMLPDENTLTSSSKCKSSPNIINSSSKTASNTMNQNADSKYYTVSL